MRHRRLVVLVLLAGITSACVKTGARDARDATGLQAPGAPASEYREHAPGPAALVGEAASPALSSAIESVARTQRSALAGDARLARLARFLLETQAQRGQVAASSQLADFVLRHLGCYDVEPEIVALEIPVDGAARALSDGLAPKLAARRFTHYGAASVARDAGSLVVVVLAERGASLAPIARSVAPGSSVRVQGRLLGGASHARVEVIAPGAQPTMSPAGASSELDVQVPVPTAGTYRIDVVGDDELGTLTLARVVIYADNAVPTAIEPASLVSPVDPSAVREALLAQLDAERKQRGLASLVVDPTLARIAQRHSADMRDHDFVDHGSVQSGGPADRAARAGLGAGLLLENIVRGSDAAGLHASSMSQPDLQRSIVHPDATHVGLGVVQLSGGTLLATELFAGQPQALDRAALAEQLVVALNRARAAAGVAPVVLAAELSQVAERAASRFVESASVTEKTVVEGANAELQSQAAIYSRVSTLLLLARAQRDVTVPDAALDPSLRAIGIGVAQGSRPDRGGEVLSVAFVLAWPR